MLTHRHRPDLFIFVYLLLTGSVPYGSLTTANTETNDKETETSAVTSEPELTYLLTTTLLKPTKNLKSFNQSVKTTVFENIPPTTGTPTKSYTPLPSKITDISSSIQSGYSTFTHSESTTDNLPFTESRPTTPVTFPSPFTSSAALESHNTANVSNATPTYTQGRTALPSPTLNLYSSNYSAFSSVTPAVDKMNKTVLSSTELPSHDPNNTLSHVVEMTATTQPISASPTYMHNRTFPSSTALTSDRTAITTPLFTTMSTDLTTTTLPAETTTTAHWPEKPTNCTFMSASSHSVTVSWNKVETNGIVYSIRCKECPDTCTKVSNEQTSCTVPDLISNRQYNMTIQTSNCSANNCSATIESEPCIVKTRTAPESPENITIDTYNETTLKVSWSIRAHDKFNVSYYVKLNDDKNGSTNISELSHTFYDLLPGTHYRVSVLSFYNGDRKQEDPWLQSVFTNKSTYTLPEKPKVCMFVSASSNSVTVSWNEVNSSVIGYNISCDECPTKYTNVPNNETSFTMPELRSNRQYNMSVTSVWSADNCSTLETCNSERNSEPCIVQTRTAPEPPESITFSNYTDTTLSVRWSTGDSYTNDIWFRVRLNGDIHNSTNTSQMFYNFYGLSPRTQYNVTIISYYSGNRKPEEPLLQSVPKTNSTYTLPEKPTVCKFSSASSNSVTVSWSKLNTSFIACRVRCIGCSTMFVNISSGETKCILQNLTSNTRYNVTVRSVWSAYDCLTNENCVPLRESEPCMVETRTAPEPTVAITFSSINETSLKATWKIEEPGTDDVSFFVQLSGNINKSTNISEMFYVFYGLSSGTLYNVTIISYYDGDEKIKYPSLQSIPTSSSTYTRPSALQSLNVLTATESNVTVELIVANDRYKTFEVRVSPSELEKGCYTNKTTNQSILTCTKLTAMRTYKLEVATKIGNITSLPKAVNVTTAPTTPKAQINLVHTTKIQVILPMEESQQLFYFYIIKHNQSSYKNETITTNETTKGTTKFWIDRLTPGTFYTVKVYASLNGWHCDVPALLESYTTPSSVSSINVTASNSTALNVSWIVGEGNYDNFTIGYFNCWSPDNGSFVPSNQTTRSLFVIKGGLTPGSTCNVSVTVQAGQQISEARFLSTAQSTLETAPSEVTDLQFNTLVNKSHQLKVSWKTPSPKNGIIRGYKIIVKQKDTCIYSHYFNCSNCKPIDSYFENHSSSEDDKCQAFNITMFNSSKTDFALEIRNLEPYTHYSVDVSAFTTFEGREIHLENITDEDIPSAPGEPVLISFTKDSLAFQWAVPNKTNGLIREYKINYEYFEPICRGHGSKIYTTETLKNFTQSTLSSKMDRNYSLHHLHPSWSYNISIEARTSKGYGSPSTTKSFITAESEPGVVNNTDVKIQTYAYNITLGWAPPCYSNGDIIYYNISWTNRNSQSNKGSNVSRTTNITYLDILPYRNYTFRIAAVNKYSQGRFTDEFDCRSNIAEPARPKDIKVIALSSTAIRVSWQQLKENEYTGPTYYNVTVFDNANKSLNYSNISEGYNATFCDVDKLDEYWTYTVKVIAKTVDPANNIENFTSESDENPEITTEEDKPGPVRNINATPEDNVMERRSIRVEWQQPIERDLNGILTKYYIRYSIDTEQIKTEEISPQRTKTVLESDIKTGLYNITIFAATKAGNGTLKSISSVKVKPGAPLKPIENSFHRMVSKSSNNNFDSQTQLAVLLDRQTFLCNNSNGLPVMWGVIVAQEDKATDPSFFGSSEDYNKRLLKYKRWVNIKDSENIEPYRATDEGWRPCDDFGRRLKRSTDWLTSEEQKPYEFIVGNETDCKDKSNDICNGQLPSGRSFRVKSFVCTELGCTETQYSLPIKTAERIEKSDTASNPTVAIVAGMVSGILVIACVLVVVFLKRRGKACFAKSIEEPNFEPELEMMGTSKFRPGAVKLADFPAHVDALKTDSGLLFADGFRLLKEQSPSHPTTVAELQACRPKTRYTNILPFDHSRVKLLPLDDEEGSDFINANFIPGYTSRREYIATQGPLPATKDDFWRMVWEQNVDIIVMLTRCVEKGKRKCDEYWPEVVQEPVYSGDLIVNVQSESTLSDYVIRIIELKLKEQTRTVRHFSFLKWPDMGSPDDPEMLLKFVKTVREFVKPDNKKPIIVHCSAGVGRTGTFIAVDRLLQHIRDHDEVDVYNVILDMRNYRCNMVQTEDQFIYIYECIRDFITTDDEEEQEEKEHLYENTKFEQNIYENTAFQNE